MNVTKTDYQSNVENAWCPGCGNFAILKAVTGALVELNLAPHQVLICSGIGQAPKLPHYIRVNTFNGLHGREVAAATAAKAAASDLTVLVHAGDGGAYGEGGNHFLHAIRRNPNITLVVHDNKTYGLTKGQASPTAESGTIVPLCPNGVISSPLNPLTLAISQGCSFVAQGSSAHVDHLTSLLKVSIKHKGFSYINVLQPCVTWDKIHTYSYLKERCKILGSEHDQTDQLAALKLSLMPYDEGIPIGVYYAIDRPAFEEQTLGGAYSGKPLRNQKIERQDMVQALVKRLVSGAR